MLAIIAAIIFAVAFLLDVTSTATNAVFAPASLLLLGLCCLALHIAGIGAGWSFSSRRRRRLPAGRCHDGSALPPPRLSNLDVSSRFGLA